MTKVSVAILAAGFGTRMKSSKAKVVHKAGGLTLIENAVRTALAVADPNDIVVVIGHQADQVRNAVAHLGVKFVEQTEQKGTGHAVLCCREALEPSEGLVIVTYGDGPLLQKQTLQALVNRHEEEAGATLITTHMDDPTGYGRIIRESNGDVAAIIEQKAASAAEREIREVNPGIYCFNGKRLWHHLAELKPNPAANELYLTDTIELFRKNGLRVIPFPIADANEVLGVNTRVELAEADRILRLRKAREVMLEGVTIERPETVTIDPDVTIGVDTVIEPGAQILGNTTIGKECKIGTGCILRDSKLEDNVQIDAYSVIGASHIEEAATIGPFARLRGENHIGAGAHIGNFVELKKTNFGAKAKAGHLAYVGDAEIGEGVNVGAGAITANYDGTAKHKTQIGKNSFIGSNSTLVAPIEVGEGSFVAAGSTITQSVPDDTLAIGRSLQNLKPGWPSSRKGKK
jgi:bifunctional UDP-N-acetylglucosamine pyrophosphorylase/glucosamine-1-phosphate N-acetyltransferase